jgi:hypothetical protein
MDKNLDETPIPPASDANVQQTSTSALPDFNRSRSILKGVMNASSSILRRSEDDLNAKSSNTKTRNIGFTVANAEKVEVEITQEPRESARKSDAFLEPPLIRKSKRSVSVLEVDGPVSGEEENANPNENTKTSLKSQNSFNSSGTDSQGVGKPLVEILSSKLYFFRMVFYAFFLNALLIGYTGLLVSTEGFMIKLPWIRIDDIAQILMVSLMAYVQYVTYYATNDALAVYFGMLLAQPRGYTAAVVGMVQGNLLEKILFSSAISVRSKAKRILNRLSFGYLLHVSFMVIPIMAALELTKAVRETDSGTLSCLIYHQRGQQADRGWPTFELEMGVGEYVFGTSIGNLRSQEDVPTTTFIMAPQLTDTCLDGTTISGDGFIATITTDCICSGSPNASDLISNGVPSADAATFASHHQTLGFARGMVNGVYLHGDSMSIHSLITGTNVCGGGMSRPLPVCVTNITDLRHALIRMVYMTDGTPASIAAKKATILEKKGKADIEWLYKGYLYTMGNRIAPLEMPGLFPNTVNPLLWWATVSTLQISPSMLEAGLETTFALMNKAVIQRSFGAEGYLCPQTIVIPDERVARVGGLGLRFLLIFSGAQMVVHICCFYVLYKWLLQQKPILPAIRFVSEKELFTVMIATGAFSQLLNDLSATYEPGHFWPKFDATLRVGESITTLEDPERGVIVIDRPKMVGDLSFAKYYQ